MTKHLDWDTANRHKRAQKAEYASPALAKSPDPKVRAHQYKPYAKPLPDKPAHQRPLPDPTKPAKTLKHPGARRSRKAGNPHKPSS